MFSDKRCGPDAKEVKQTYAKPKRPPPKGTSAKPVKTRRSAAELEQLTLECDAGDMKACTAWTMGGGPEMLRDKESKSEQDCEAGSLVACEERYCRERIDADCRARVQRTARLAGDTWYLRDETRDARRGHDEVRRALHSRGCAEVSRHRGDVLERGRSEPLLFR